MKSLTNKSTKKPENLEGCVKCRVNMTKTKIIKTIRRRTAVNLRTTTRATAEGLRKEYNRHKIIKTKTDEKKIAWSRMYLLMNALRSG